MSSDLPLLPALALYGLAAGLALVLTRPSSGMRTVVLTLLIGVALLGSLSLAVNWVVNTVAAEADWNYYQ
jgi:hypothetical protein